MPPNKPILTLLLGFPGGSVVKNSPAKARDTGDVGLIPGLGRSARGGNGNLLSILAWNKQEFQAPPRGGAWWATVHGVSELGTTEHTHACNLALTKRPPKFLSDHKIRKSWNCCSTRVGIRQPKSDCQQDPLQEESKATCCSNRLSCIEKTG